MVAGDLPPPQIRASWIMNPGLHFHGMREGTCRSWWEGLSPRTPVFDDVRVAAEAAPTTRTQLKTLQGIRKPARRTKAWKVESRLSGRTVHLRNPPFPPPQEPLQTAPSPLIGLSIEVGFLYLGPEAWKRGELRGSRGPGSPGAGGRWPGSGGQRPPAPDGLPGWGKGRSGPGSPDRIR